MKSIINDFDIQLVVSCPTIEAQVILKMLLALITG